MFEMGCNGAVMLAVMRLRYVNDVQSDEMSMKGCDEVPMFIYKEVLMSAILKLNCLLRWISNITYTQG